MNKQELIAQLNSFDATERKKALLELSKESFSTSTDNVNMHLHSFCSFNAEGWSPSRLAYEYRKAGLFAAGIIDFDVMDGMKEYHEAGEILGLRTSVGIETRAFLTEFSNKEIDSPGEPGVSYIAAGGFGIDLQEGSSQKKMLDYYRQTSHERNIALISRINPNVPDIAIDYMKDAVSLTPSGNATERHIIKAYINKSLAKYSDEKELLKYWSSILGKSEEETKNLLAKLPAMEEIVRSKFAKRGGFGYVQPTEKTFPKVEDFFSWVRSCEAIPMESWLDGTSEGEKDPEALLELSISKGAAALNIIPDRNWNIKDAETKAKKTANLKRIVEVASRLHLPLHIGTEMNKLGQPFVDDLDVPELKPYKELFRSGAKIFVGHTIALRFAGFSYVGKNADAMFGKDIVAKNKFFESIGALPAVTLSLADKLRSAGKEKSFTILNDSLKQNLWKV